MLRTLSIALSLRRRPTRAPTLRAVETLETPHLRSFPEQLRAARRPLGWALALVLIGSLGCAIPATPPVPAVPQVPTTATAGATTVVAVAPPAQPCCPKQTLPQWLGLTGLAKGIGGLLGRIRNRLGSRFPGLEGKPELLAITDPANLESSNPAVQEAAAVKGEEDQAAQKAKAIRYLGTIGCGGCYPEVEQAILAALDDCTEVVRFEAVKALRGTSGSPCCLCKESACCGPAVLKRLREIAYDRDAKGCFKEPSPRVRRNARLALAGCGNPPQEELPSEGPTADEGAAPETAAPETAAAAGPAAEGGGAAGGAPEGGGAEGGGDAAAGGAAGAPGLPLELPPPAAGARSRLGNSQAIAASSRRSADCCQVPAAPWVVAVEPAPAADSPTSGAGTDAMPGGAEPQPLGQHPPESTAPLSRAPRGGSAVRRTSLNQPNDRQEVLARVNGEEITLDDLPPQFRQRAERLARSIPPAGRSDARRAIMADELRLAIDRRLLCQAACEALERDPAAAERRTTETGASEVVGDWRALAERYPTHPELETQLAAAWLWQAAEAQGQVTQAEVASYYQANLEQFQRPGEFRWEQLSVDPRAVGGREEARALLEQFRGAAHDSAAPVDPQRARQVKTQVYDWATAEECGSPLVARAVSRLPVGAPSPVIDDGQQLLVVRVLQRRRARVAPLEEVADEIRGEILRQRRQRRTEVYLNWLRDRAQIETLN